MDSHRTSLNVALTDIAQARVRRDQRHGTERRSNDVWNQKFITRVGRVVDPELDLRTQLIEMAALCVSWIENLDALSG